jgi:hypothetical protein
LPTGRERRRGLFAFPAQSNFRLRALAALGEMADRGDFDEFLGDKPAYRR